MTGFADVSCSKESTQASRQQSLSWHEALEASRQLPSNQSAQPQAIQACPHQHTSAYVSLRPHTSTLLETFCSTPTPQPP
eukprot:13002_6